MFELKRLSKEGVGGALDKADKYRNLNEPGEAESICRDVLAVEPDNHRARITLLLAMTDQFPRGLTGRFDEAREMASALESDYERAYYTGLVCERRAKAHYRHHRVPGSGHVAYGWFREAMGHYEAAEGSRPRGNDEALLRWNRCARIIMKNADLRPVPEEDLAGPEPMLE